MTDPGRLTVHDVVDSPWNCNLALRAMGHSIEVGGEVVKPKVIYTTYGLTRFLGRFGPHKRVFRRENWGGSLTLFRV